jgi:hypothetical protein
LKRIRRPPVRGPKRPIAGVRLVEHPNVRHALLDVAEDLRHRCRVARNLLACRQGHRDQVRVGVTAITQVGLYLVRGDRARLPGEREVDRESAGRLTGQSDARNEHDAPEQQHPAAVPEDELSQPSHCRLLSVGVISQR